MSTRQLPTHKNLHTHSTCKQTGILRQQGCTYTPRQAFIADLRTFIKDTQRENDASKLHQICWRDIIAPGWT